MSSDRVYTPEDLALFDLLGTPTWVLDVERATRLWGNLAFLAMWGAPSREEMLARSAASPPPSETSRNRLATLQRRLMRSRQQIASQADALRRLSAPLISVGKGVLALPLIGSLDRERLDLALSALLARTSQAPVARVVLDLTGVADVDATVGAGLLRIARALRLQGIAATLSGVRPELARAIVGAGIDLSEVPCVQSIEDALAAGA